MRGYFKKGNKINLGRKLSKETLESETYKARNRKISEKRKGIIYSDETRQKMREAKLGKKASDETRKKLSIARMGNTNNKGKCGEKNHKWTGGKWAYFRRQVLLRENHTCESCGLREEGLMDVDHILPRKKYPELALDVGNLQVLCPNCHRRKTNKQVKLWGRKYT